MIRLVRAVTFRFEVKSEVSVKTIPRKYDEY